MITILLEKIITILEGWIQSFTSHSQNVEDKLDSLDQTASDIETNTEPISDIADNTGAVITPIQNIKSNTDSIATSSQTSANNTTAILNNIGTLSTNTGRAAAYAQDCANNTLEIKDKITTIASDTTQLRADSANIAADVSSINQALGYYLANMPVTEDSEGDICNFDTDLEDYLQDLKVNIPADLTGFSDITLIKTGKNLFNPQNIITGRFLDSIGAPRNATGWNISDYIPIKAGLVYHFTPNTTAGQSAKHCFYNANKEFLDYINSGEQTFTTPEGCAFIRFSYRDDSIAVQLELGSIATTYEPYKGINYPVSFGSTITDGAEADLLSGLVKVNTTPESFLQIQPITVRTYKGVNNIYSDIGTSALTYRETLKHYLDKNNQ